MSSLKKFAPLPTAHVQSLKSIESGYWWFVGRVYWATQIVLSHWPDIRKGGYADIGCGTGGFGKAVKEHFGFQKVALVDPDPLMIETAGVTAGVTTIVSSFDDLKLPFRPSLITCMDVIEHIENDADFLRKLWATLDDKGCLILSVPAMPVLYSDWDKIFGHYRRYTRTDLTDKLQSVGFSVRFISYQWSFAVPLFPYRLLKQRLNRHNTEFDRVPDWLNALLISLSRLEWALAKKLALPLGTSLMVAAEKR